MRVELNVPGSVTEPRMSVQHQPALYHGVADWFH